MMIEYSMDANTLASNQYVATVFGLTVFGIFLLGAIVGVVAMWWFYRGRK